LDYQKKKKKITNFILHIVFIIENKDKKQVSLFTELTIKFCIFLPNSFKSSFRACSLQKAQPRNHQKYAENCQNKRKKFQRDFFFGLILKCQKKKEEEKITKNTSRSLIFCHDHLLKRCFLFFLSSHQTKKNEMKEERARSERLG
jgi:hypothetical protein